MNAPGLGGHEVGRLRRSAIRQAARIGVVYAIVGILWSAFSDRTIRAAFPAEQAASIETYDDWVFVFATAVLIVVLASRALSGHLHTVDALSRSEARLRMYLRHAPMAVFVMDAEGRCLEANERAATLVGCSPPELKTLSINDVIPTESDAAIAAGALAKLATEHWVEGEYRLKRRDGRVIWVGARAVRLEDGRLLAFADDVSERKAGEARLRQAATVFASTHEGVIITDRDARIIAANPAFTTITGYEEAEVVGSDPRVLQSGVQSRDWYRNLWRALREAGRWQGEIWNRRKTGEIYPERLTISAVRNDAGETINYVGVFTDITGIKHSEAELDHLAHTDALTGLPNRLLLTSRLEHAIARATKSRDHVAVMSLNLDRFKQVNDSHGFEAGDELLKLVADRLQTKMKPGETLARLGADEFIAIFEDLPVAEAAADIARVLLSEFDRRFDLASGETVRLGASIGISLFPDDGTTEDQLLQQAGAAVSYAKDMGGRGMRFHTPSMVDSAQARFAMEASLHEANERRQFILHYQPRVSLDTGLIEGVEALIRWRRPDGLLVAPAEFIPLAEATGLIGPIGDWVLIESCRQMQRWLANGLPLKTMAVNVSPKQFSDPAFVGRVRAVLEETGLASRYLELEITENDIMESGPDVDARLAAIGELGVRLAIDDFGAGHSSLANLRRLPVHTLKIDQSFLKDVPADQVSTGVVLMITTLASHLHLQTVAEGVENEAQRLLLQKAGCHLAQGYMFSRPAAPDEIAAQVMGQTV